MPGQWKGFCTPSTPRISGNSNKNEARDRLGFFAKFCPPVVANGTVYMSTFAEPAKAGHTVHPNKLVVYGILPWRSAY
jgi:hypothetical protein